MRIKQILLGAAIAAGALTATTGGASAYVVCNRVGDCWHTQTRYAYRPSFGITIHDDNWRWRDSDRFRWREHPGRGYWRGGVWITF